MDFMWQMILSFLLINLNYLYGEVDQRSENRGPSGMI